MKFAERKRVIVRRRTSRTVKTTVAFIVALAVAADFCPYPVLYGFLLALLGLGYALIWTRR